MIAIALFFFVLSYLIWVRKLLLVIAGIPRKCPTKHERQMTKDGSILSLVCGIFTCLLAYFQDVTIMFVIYGIAILMMCIFFIKRATTYSH